MDENRRAAWEAAIAKRERGEDVPPDERNALLRDGMFNGEATPVVMEEAALFLRYWLHGLSLEPLPWFGEIIAASWFHLRDWDREWNRNRADKKLRDYVAAEDFDHWEVLNIIAARLHRQREALPDVLADWAAEFHEGKRPRPPKGRGNRGEPPYAHEERNGIFFMADDWLEHFGMSRAADRLAAIAAFAEVDEEVVRRGLTRWRDSQWQRAPWPKR